jgi:hypothetical protein
MMPWAKDSKEGGNKAECQAEIYCETTLMLGAKASRLGLLFATPLA